MKAMGPRARMRQTQEQGCIHMRYLRRTATVGLSFLSLFLSHWLLYPRKSLELPIGGDLLFPDADDLQFPPADDFLFPDTGDFQFPDPGEVSNEDIVEYSQFNPAVSIERDRIKFLLNETSFGSLSVRQVMHLRRSPGARNSFKKQISRRTQNAWMLPFVLDVDRCLPEVFKLIQTWLGDVGESFNPRVTQDLVRRVKRSLDQNNAHWKKTADNDFIGERKYQSCAVVGNSGILLNGSYGDQIDSHEVVIRLNNAEISNFGAHVGSKTTLSFMNSNVFRSWSRRAGCRCHEYIEEHVAIVLYICQARHFIDVARCTTRSNSRRAAYSHPVLLTHSHFDALCAAIAKWYSVTDFLKSTGRALSEWDSVHDELQFHYSSGMQAVVLALGMCDTVDLFGFGKFANATHHYHTKRKEELSLHDFAAEYLFYDDLVHNRTVPFLSDAGISIPLVRIYY